ncbi:hypothetical protein BFJ66_g8955 [Fusarium oxysporum f. sp. cepae]|nr:hypothetical protein BFJ66_g8955 [Fusarium oxysporum f. sp. cepae]
MFNLACLGTVGTWVEVGARLYPPAAARETGCKPRMHST